MIPKIVHYCWFGNNPLPSLAIKCIHSWKEYLPEYEIKEWNETNFDISLIPYIQEAYQAKKYAFVSDYARFWILYQYGGLYFDVDVEIIKPLDDILAKGPFMGCEKDGSQEQEIAVAPGLGLASRPGMSFYKRVLDYYSSLHFFTEEGTMNMSTVVEYTTQLLFEVGLENKSGIQKVNDIYIYPKAFFCPLDSSLSIYISSDTRTIHHYNASWLPPHKQYIKKIKRLLGYSFSSKLSLVLKKILLLSK
ncbi:glycosyl transferase [Parabacteroides faecis]|uniref:glycosyltransferase family 32 protein n=1 Tax=Parabacteroides faecis TaxID=1217282 RepID=UPI0021645C0C|nr:glycosyltransferase [Parabacteroides faecis]MCS2894133.1 glycosyl transferase [Parabacteroides faecis]UVQ47281.1 glycosyl transferase [Parabacteroides faecis]